MSQETELQQPKFVECKACDGMGEVIWDDEDGHFEELCDVCKGACEVIIEKKLNDIPVA